jgi:hypothetical protein
MDVVNAVSCVFLFIVAGPFLEKLFLSSASPNTQLRQQQEP